MMEFSPRLLLFARVIAMNIFQLSSLSHGCWRMCRTWRESPSCSDELPAGWLCDLGKGNSHLFSSPISFAYVSISFTVRYRVPPVWLQVFIAEQISAFSVQSLAFISTLFSCLGNDVQRWALLAGHQCDDHQRTQQRKNIVRCKPDTNIEPHNASQPQWSRRNLAILPVVGLLELWKGLGTKDVCRAATDPSQPPTTSLLASLEWCTLFFVLWRYWVSSSYSCLLLLLSTQAWELELKMLLCVS